MPRRIDDFSPEVKDLLAKRVGMQCSNPNCRQPTSGPQEDPKKVLNIGVASHITAAAKGGPRYDPRMSSQERKSEANGLWLCQNCGKLVDNDKERFTADTLRQWRRLSEEAARLAIEAPARNKTQTAIPDVDLIRFYSQCFDRPAFQDYFHQEGSMESFDRAIEDTITAINTGCLRARDGTPLARSRGKAFLSRDDWRDRMDLIIDLLRAIRSRYDDARKTGAISVDAGSDREFYCINDLEICEWMDSTRAQVLGVFAEICEEAGIRAPTFPHRRSAHR
jgi:hypothetical protein